MVVIAVHAIRFMAVVIRSNIQYDSVYWRYYLFNNIKIRMLGQAYGLDCSHVLCARNWWMGKNHKKRWLRHRYRFILLLMLLLLRGQCHKYSITVNLLKCALLSLVFLRSETPPIEWWVLKYNHLDKNRNISFYLHIIHQTQSPIRWNELFVLHTGLRFKEDPEKFHLHTFSLVL